MTGPDTVPVQTYLSGERLVGDDFGPEEIAAWYQDEMEAYADLGAADPTAYRYGYHALNRRLGFRFLPVRRGLRALGIGSAYGHEFLPVTHQLSAISILEPSERLVTEEVGGVPVEYHRPSVDGRLPFADGSFDLVTCLGALHHIPNVSFVVGEIGRVLSPGGHVVLREPIVNMGDWRQPRPGLTPRERGIPPEILMGALDRAGVRIVRATPCIFPPLVRVAKALGLHAPLDRPALVGLDVILSRLTYWGHRYDRKGPLGKATPTSLFVVGRRIAP